MSNFLSSQVVGTVILIGTVLTGSSQSLSSKSVIVVEDNTFSLIISQSSFSNSSVNQYSQYKVVEVVVGVMIYGDTQ